MALVLYKNENRRYFCDFFVTSIFTKARGKNNFGEFVIIEVALKYEMKENSVAWNRDVLFLQTDNGIPPSHYQQSQGQVVVAVLDWETKGRPLLWKGVTIAKPYHL